MTVPVRCACRLPLTVGAALSVLFAFICMPAVAAAQTVVTLNDPRGEITADTTIRGGGYASFDYSGSGVLVTKTTSDKSYTRRILMKFDTENRIPKGAVINSAKLYLVLKNADGGTSRPLTAFRVGKSFLRGQTTWFDYRDNSPWSSPGGDFTERFTTTNVGTSVGSTYTFDLTQLVQKSVNGVYGSRYTRLALVDTGAGSRTSYRAFHSTRASNTAARPRLVISYGAASSVTNGGSGGTTLRVMQWNIRHTKGSDGRFDPNRVASAVVRLRPDVVSVNEVSYYHRSFINDDLGAMLERMLEQKTGQNWYRKFINVFGGSHGYGNLLLSRYQPSSSSSTLLSYERGVVQQGIVVNGRTVNIFSTHVDYFNGSYRTTQTNQAKNWGSSYSAPRIILGDFNTSPGTSDYAIMANSYVDAWAQAKKNGTATSFNGTGATRGTSRFDYVVLLERELPRAQERQRPRHAGQRRLADPITTRLWRSSRSVRNRDSGMCPSRLAPRRACGPLEISELSRCEHGTRGRARANMRVRDVEKSRHVVFERELGPCRIRKRRTGQTLGQRRVTEDALDRRSPVVRGCLPGHHDSSRANRLGQPADPPGDCGDAIHLGFEHHAPERLVND